MHILVVEDNYDVRTLVTYLLQSEGYAVSTAGDGMEALQIDAALAPDMLILDVNLPLMDGYDVCRRVKSRRDVPIVMLTVRAEPADVELARNAGADLHFVKPFDMTEFLGAIANLGAQR